MKTLHNTQYKNILKKKIIMNLRKNFVLRHNTSLNRLCGTVGWACANKAGRFGSIPRWVKPKTCQTVLAACPCSTRARRLWVDARKRFTCVQPLTRHPSGAITANADACPTVRESRDGRLQTTRDTPEGLKKSSINATELSSQFNRKPHVNDQDFTAFNMSANHFQLLDGKSTKVLDGKCRLLCGPAKYLRRAGTGPRTGGWEPLLQTVQHIFPGWGKIFLGGRPRLLRACLQRSVSSQVLARHLQRHPSLRLLDTSLVRNSFTALQLSNKSFIAAMFSGRLYLHLLEGEFVPFFYSTNFLNIAVVYSAFLKFYFGYFNDLIYRWTHNIFMILISAWTAFAAAWMIWIFIPDAFGNCVKQSGPVLTLTSQVLGGMCAFCFKSIT